MEGILNLLRKLGYSENEIKNVLNKVPVEQQGKMGTNVATGIFSKPKEGQLAKDFLISDVIGNPFEINYYAGRTRDDILKSAEAQLKMIDDELTKITDQILNKNLKLTEEQKINFAKNLEAKRRFEKDFEAFKTKPEAEVLNMQTGKTVEDVEALKEKSGLMAPPSTPLGQAEFGIKRLKSSFEDFVNKELNPEYIAKKEAERKANIARQYEGKGYAGDVLYGPSGIYRATAREFLLDQNAKGKIKLSPDTIENLKERNYISGGQPLMYADPIRIMRYHYGDDVFDKIPVDQLSRTSGTRSEILNIMSKVETPPVKVEPPKTAGGYLTPGEYNARIEELQNIEKSIKRRESRFADMTDEEIQNELSQYGSQRSAFEMGLESDYPEEYAKYKKSQVSTPESKSKVLNIQEEGTKRKSIDELIDEYNANQDKTLLTDEEGGSAISYQEFQDLHKRNEEIAKILEDKGIPSKVEEKPQAEIIPFRKKPTEPEGKANGGRIGFAYGSSKESLGLDYLSGVERNYSGRSNFQKGSVPKMLEFLIEKLSAEKNFNKTLLERSNPKAIQELYIEQFGKLPSAEEIKDIVNKQLQNKGSMETINRKTGEVGPFKEPVMTAESKSRRLTKDEIADYEELIGRDSEQWMLEGTVREAEEALKRSKAEESYYRSQYKMGKLDPEPGEQTEARMKFLQKKLEEASDVKDRRLITPKEVKELMELESRFIYKKGDYITEENFGSSPFAPSQETLDNLKKAREMTKGMNLEEEMNMILNQYDKSMFIKNEQGMVDVTNPENVQKMALLLKRDHPELYRRLEMQIGNQNNVLEDFDVTGRKPNANGGLNYLMGF